MVKSSVEFNSDTGKCETSKRTFSLREVEELIWLVRQGDAQSLTQLRHRLGRTGKELADLVGVSEEQLEKWEGGDEEPSSLHHAFWKLKLSDYVDEEVSRLLHTDNREVINQFWELIWRLNY